MRKRPAHPPVHELINRPVVVFVTLCTHQRRPVLTCSFMHDLLRAAWHEAEHWRVGRCRRWVRSQRAAGVEPRRPAVVASPTVWWPRFTAADHPHEGQ